MSWEQLVEVDSQPALDSERLVLEPLLPLHAARTLALWQDERLYTFIPFRPPTELLGLEERYRKLAARRSPDGTEEWLNWFAREKTRGEYVAQIQVTVRPDSSAHLAYFTFVSQWRRGFAYEACQAVIRWLIDRGVEEFVAEIDTRNVASIRLIERLGFRRVAYVPKAALIRGAASDEYHYSLTVPRKSSRP
jgi:[ribosomal protein S5]-alanine N-acetyltransferase